MRIYIYICKYIKNSSIYLYMCLYLYTYLYNHRLFCRICIYTWGDSGCMIRGREGTRKDTFCLSYLSVFRVQCSRTLRLSLAVTITCWRLVGIEILHWARETNIEAYTKCMDPLDPFHQFPPSHCATCRTYFSRITKMVDSPK